MTEQSFPESMNPHRVKMEAANRAAAEGKTQKATEYLQADSQDQQRSREGLASQTTAEDTTAKRLTEEAHRQRMREAMSPPKSPEPTSSEQPQGVLKYLNRVDEIPAAPPKKISFLQRILGKK